MKKQTTTDYSKFYKTIYWLLIVIFFFKLSGFFTWSENVGITRVVKVLTRISMTIFIYLLYKKIVAKGSVASFKWSNPLSIILYCAYLLLGMVSFLWSTDFGYSALQWIMDFESLVFSYYFIACFVLLDKYFPQSDIRLSNVLGNVIVMMLTIFIVGMFAAPDQFYRLTHGGEEQRLGGYFMNPNELGMIGGVGISCLIFDLYRKQNPTWTIIKIASLLFVVVMTGSRSSTIGCLLIAFFHIRQGKNVKLKLSMYAGAALAVPVAISKIMIKQGGLDEVLSMTGRLPFWKALITEGLPREILFGFGFMRIDYKDHFESVHTYAGHMTHNTFMQVLMNLGFVGFTLVVIQVAMTFRGFLNTPEPNKKLMLIGIIIPVLINSFTEFGIFGETNYGILFYQMLVFYICIATNDKLTPKEVKYLMRTRPEMNQPS
jgi:exopolysaccharide production protein ExoQ